MRGSEPLKPRFRQAIEIRRFTQIIKLLRQNNPQNKLSYYREKNFDVKYTLSLTSLWGRVLNKKMQIILIKYTLESIDKIFRFVINHLWG